MPDYLFNTTALSNFAAIARFDLLKSLYLGKAFTTIEVSHELQRGIHAGYRHLESAWQQIRDVHPSSGWIRILTPETPEEYQLQAELDNRLDQGEASCLALAVTRQFIFVTDDLAARRLASEKNVLLTGTLGILIRGVQGKFLPLTEANHLLKIMVHQGYRSPVNCLDDFIQ